MQSSLINLKITYKWPTDIWKVANVTNQRNANQNCSEIPPHTCGDSYYHKRQKITSAVEVVNKKESLCTVGRNINLYSSYQTRFICWMCSKLNAESSKICSRGKAYPQGNWARRQENKSQTHLPQGWGSGYVWEKAKVWRLWEKVTEDKKNVR